MVSEMRYPHPRLGHGNGAVWNVATLSAIPRGRGKSADFIGNPFSAANRSRGFAKSGIISAPLEVVRNGKRNGQSSAVIGVQERGRQERRHIFRDFARSRALRRLHRHPLSEANRG